MCDTFEKFEKEMKEKSGTSVSASALPSKDKKDKLFYGIYTWYLYTRKKSKSELADWLRSRKFIKEAQKVYPSCEFKNI